MKTTTLLGREPAVWAGLVAVAVQFVAAFVIDVNQDTQTAVNVTAAALLGLLVAFKVGDGQVAALTGFAQAALALGMNLGLDWSADRQAAVMAAVTVIAQAFVRTQVTAPVARESVKVVSAVREV
ncbi:hypothetical protein SAM23877_p111 (plasmid) [Streptomyces ambofaciens ATCC 23877]|uniref:Holin n=1 Tax=Streptomyces ambofaciens (strain ATCC 23877 / 3486 / DSM 40053 / JCM 4204 / NBRC 12836 / NRRL B-2516) TaxID=278992 RepID=A0A0K2B5Z2_STRA7|nr:hypothetical protein [Streptomyces ambofaciens]AKZ60820.1 hypothetical protein SAM23877_p111 [Streptomyces ambofaciens ATCC 23877]